MSKLISNVKSPKGHILQQRALHLLILLGCFLNATSAQDPFDLPRVMDRDPEFVEVTPKVVLAKQLIPVWINAIQSDDISLQRRAAESITIAKQRGMKGLEQVHDVLIESVGSPNRHRQVRVAIAKAIVAFDLKRAENQFVRLAETTSDFELMSVIYPALAHWETESARALWKKNVSQKGREIHRQVLSIQGLARLGDDSIVDHLKKIVTEENSNYRLRYHSANAIGQLVNLGLETYAGKLANSNQVANRILAASVLTTHQSAEGIAVLKKLAADPEPAVAYLGWSAILDSKNPRELDPLVDFAQQNRGPKVRLKLIELLELWQDQAAIEKLGQLLADVHPQVRVSARQMLLKFAKENTLRSLVIEAAASGLERNWQSIQQGLLILTTLDHKPAAMKMIPLLDHGRAEVHLTAGWSLENLSVKETLEPITKRLESQITGIKSGDLTGMDKSKFESISHLIQLLGKNKHSAMQKVIIRKLIPKDMNLFEHSIREAAIWSLGQIYMGEKLPEDLRESLRQRLLDDDPMNPEDSYVKSMCAFTFAVTGSKSTIEDIEKYADSKSNNSRFGFYCNWALNRLDGREIPIVEPFERNDTDWFLYPLE